ncbi:hypothetical protein EV1_035842 [Malus domestica]
MFDVLLQVLLRDVGAGKSSLVLRFIKEQLVEFQVLRGEAHLKFTGRTREEADSNGMVNVKEKDAKAKASEFLLRRKAIQTANKTAQRYERDADYCFLHDCVSDIFAQCLKAEYKREQLAAANEIDPSDAALLPHDILSYIKYPELEQ